MVKTLLKNGREKKGYTTRQVSKLLKIDQALISKFENGLRRPTKEQITNLSALFEIDLETITVLWLKEKILDTIADEEYGVKAIQAAASEILTDSKSTEKSNAIDTLFEEMNALKSKIEGLRDAQG